MSPNPKCLKPSDTVQQAATLMAQHDIGTVLICEPESGKLLGIVTDRDIATKAVAAGLPVTTPLEKISTWNPACCREVEEVAKAINLMTVHQVRRIPIMNEIGRLTGIISQGDIAVRVHQANKTADVVTEVSQPHAVL